MTGIWMEAAEINRRVRSSRVSAVLASPIAPIVRAVAECYHVSVGDLVGQRQTKACCKARLIVYLLAREQNRWSYPDLGGWLNRDHSAIITGVRSATRKFGDDPTVKGLRELLAAQGVIPLDAPRASRAGKPIATHCSRGHAFTDDKPSARRRGCKICRTARERNRRERGSWVPRTTLIGRMSRMHGTPLCSVVYSVAETFGIDARDIMSYRGSARYGRLSLVRFAQYVVAWIGVEQLGLSYTGLAGAMGKADQALRNGVAVVYKMRETDPAFRDTTNEARDLALSGAWR